MSSLSEMEPEARQIRLNQLGKQNAEVGSKEHQEHEDKVNEEASRLGFTKEIQALEGT